MPAYIHSLHNTKGLNLTNGVVLGLTLRSVGCIWAQVLGLIIKWAGPGQASTWLDKARGCPYRLLLHLKLK